MSINTMRDRVGETEADDELIINNAAPRKSSSFLSLLESIVRKSAEDNGSSRGMPPLLHSPLILSANILYSIL
jgi:hypothetical protein